MELENVEKFRKGIAETLKDNEIASAVDERDLKRLERVDNYVSCFINWRKGDVEAAIKLAVDVLKWRKEREINDLVKENIDLELMQRGIIYVHGNAIDGTRIVYFVTRLQTKDIKAQVQTILTLWLERLHQQETGKHITFLLDVSKSSLMNVDLGGIKFLLDCFSQYFPDMLERIIILEMPWIMNAIWKIVKQWMTEEQRRRTVFCGFKDLKQYIDADNKLVYMGGKDTWKYTYPPRTDEVPSLEQQANFDYASESMSESTQEQSEMQSENNMSEEEFVVDDVEITTTEQTSILSETPQQVIEKAVSVPGEPVSCDDMRSEESSTTVTSSEDITEERAPLVNGLISMRTSENGEESSNTNIPAVKFQSPGGMSPTNHSRCPSTENESNLNRGANHDRNTPRPIMETNASDQIKLGSLLIMSPVTEVLFVQENKDQTTGRCRSSITLTNPNAEVQVAFKVKTNSPERYHVKPSTGSIPAGATITIRINLSPGYEETISRDRFLILYQKMEEDCDITEFWSNHMSKEARFEHRVRVRFETAPPREKPALPHPRMTSRPSVLPVESKEKTSFDAEFAQLNREVSGLKTKLMLAEHNTRWFRTRFKYSMILQLLLLVLLLFVIYELSLLTALVRLVTSFLGFLWGFGAALAADERIIAGLPSDRPLIVAHRGSSGMRPEHTVAAYQLAVDQGADVIECDIAVSKDLKLVCTHDAWLKATTDVASRPEFADRLRSYVVQGINITDYFTVDFTLAELKTLRKVQDRSYRDQSYNRKFPMASFDEYVAVAQNASNGRTIGIYPETKNPDFFNPILALQNVTMEDLLLDSLENHGYVDRTSPCFVQSFSEDSLLYMSNRTELPLVFLTGTALTDSRLADLSLFCYGLGPSKNTIVQVNQITNRVIGSTEFLDRAHAHGFKVHPYTFRNEYQFLAWDYGSDPYREYEKFVSLGVDGLFTDYPWSLSNYLQLQNSYKSSCSVPTPHLYFTAMLILVSLCARF